MIFFSNSIGTKNLRILFWAETDSAKVATMNKKLHIFIDICLFVC